MRECPEPQDTLRPPPELRYRPRGVSLPVRAVRRPRRDAVNVDLGFNAQDRLVLALGGHLGSCVIGVGVVSHLLGSLTEGGVLCVVRSRNSLVTSLIELLDVFL